MKKSFRVVFLSALGFTIAAPLLAFAAINESIPKGYADSIISLINHVLVPGLIAIAFIVFLWGIFKYFIWNGENESEKAEGRKYAMWGIVGFVVIVSVWGLVNLVKDTFGLGGQNNPAPPIFNTSGGGNQQSPTPFNPQN